MQRAFDLIKERLEEYTYTHLTEHDSEQCLHCQLIDCDQPMDCTHCVMDKAKEIVNQVAEEYKHVTTCYLQSPCEYQNEDIRVDDSIGWIPCSERLPEDRKSVLVWFEYFRYGRYNMLYQTYGFSEMINGRWSGLINGETGWRDLKIIAWQPLPEPYKAESEE